MSWYTRLLNAVWAFLIFPVSSLLFCFLYLTSVISTATGCVDMKPKKKKNCCIAAKWTIKSLTESKLRYINNRGWKVLQSDCGLDAGWGRQTSRHLIKLNLNPPSGVHANTLHHLSLLKHLLVTRRQWYVHTGRPLRHSSWEGCMTDGVCERHFLGLMRGNYLSWQVVWCHRVMNGKAEVSSSGVFVYVWEKDCVCVRVFFCFFGIHSLKKHARPPQKQTHFLFKCSLK